MKAMTTRTIKMLAAALMAAVLAISLSACGGKSDEEVIREGVNADFESVKNFDEESIFSDVSEFTEWDEFGIDSTEFLKKWLDGFDYSVDEVTVDGDNALVKVTITVKSFEQIMTDFQEKGAALTQTDEASDMSQDDLYKELGTILMQGVDEASLATTTVDLPYVLNGNEWGPGADFDTVLAEAFFGGLI